MKLTFLGSGSAFTTDGNWHSNVLVEIGGKRLLIDCGSDARHSAKELGLTALDIDAVFVSHLHADHVGGLEWLGFSTYFAAKKPAPDLFVSTELADPLWDNCLRGGMSSLQGQLADMGSFFRLHRVPRGGNFLWQGVRFQLVQAIHVFNGHALAHAYGLLFPAGSKTVYFSGDQQFSPGQNMPFYRKADVIFHDTEITPSPSGVHPHYEQLRTLPDDVRSRMWLYHVNPGPRPDARADGFAGFVDKGQVFDFSTE